jgi:hypothetical protein
MNHFFHTTWSSEWRIVTTLSCAAVKLSIISHMDEYLDSGSPLPEVHLWCKKLETRLPLANEARPFAYFVARRSTARNGKLQRNGSLK